jgi:hypothetical protein
MPVLLKVKGTVMKKVIGLISFTAIIFFVTGCGPGQQFEIESQHLPQSELSAHVFAAG